MGCATAFFFFQAEDGIRDVAVTGVQTCALPISDETWQLDHFPTRHERAALGDQMDPTDLENALAVRASSEDAGDFDVVWEIGRACVGKECRSRWSPYH